MVRPLRRMPKASGWTERSPPARAGRPPCRKYLDALRGGSIWTSFQPRERDCRARAAMKPCTAVVCSRFLRSCLLPAPDTLRQERGASGSSGVTLQRLLATPTEARSLRASTASPPSVRARVGPGLERLPRRRAGGPRGRSLRGESPAGTPAAPRRPSGPPGPSAISRASRRAGRGRASRLA